LEKGQDELNIRLDKASRRGFNADASDAGMVGSGGVSLGTVEDLKTLLKDLDPTRFSLNIQSRQATPSIYALLMAAFSDLGIDPAEVKGCLGMDPAGSMAKNGTATSAVDNVLDMVAALMGHAVENAPQLQLLDVQGHPYHDGGASSTQEMAAVLSAAVFYLRELSDRGIPVEQIVPRMRLSVSIGGDYFIEIAKLRAMRLLWSRIMDAFEVPEDARSIHIHARTGLWNKTVFDPYVNMLRTTTEAFSAVVGGCDSLHVGPFDEVIREANEFSNRIAFNMHAILAEECDMRRVIDPAGGSWAVESLTDQMAASAWKTFQEIEAGGGIISALESGKLQESVEAVRQKRAKNIQRRKDVIVGTNSYPNATEELLDASGIDYKVVANKRAVEISEWKNQRDNAGFFTYLEKISEVEGSARIEAMIKASSKGATLGELQASAGLGTLLEKAKPIAMNRAASEFEALRLAAKTLTDEGKAPVLHQLNMGPSRRYRIRADWTSAFFQVSGINVLSEDDYAGVEEAVAALKNSGAKIAVITSDDETYGATVEPLAKAIKEVDPGIVVYVAGAPGENEETWKAAGVDGFVNIRVNNYELNRKLLESLGAEL
jgi:methylmalonyl-CoA mutase